MSRVDGATPTEWAAYNRARLNRRLAREQFLLAARQFNKDAAFFLGQLRRPHFERAPNWADSLSSQRRPSTASATEINKRTPTRASTVEQVADRSNSAHRANSHTAAGIALGAAAGVAFGVALGQALTGDGGSGMAIGIVVAVAISAGIGALVGIALDSRQWQAAAEPRQKSLP
jgi:hypothetical protein